MNKFLKYFLIVITLIFFGGFILFKIYFSAEKITERQVATWNERVSNFSKNKISKDSVFSNDIKFIEDSILKGKYKINLEKSLTNCPLNKYKKSDLINNFGGFQNIGDIDKDGKDDFVFVIQPLNMCENGESYYFSNPKIPRIFSDSYCCQPGNVFSIGDIDEDGSNEIAQYYSSCVSRYKSINIWTLKNNVWKKVEEFTFCINNEYEPGKDFHKLYKKIKKNEFQFLDISDVKGNGEIIKEWKTIEMK